MEVKGLGFNADVSIVMPVHNGSRWLNDCLTSILSQTGFNSGSLEFSVYNDASTDSTSVILKSWVPRLEQKGIKVVIGGSDGDAEKGDKPRGTGYGRNQAIFQSSGKFLCFMDADDVMAPDRIAVQYVAAVALDSDVLIGSCFAREPPGSTERYTRWSNTLSQSQLYTQAFTAFGPTLIQPTWFCSRALFDKVGPFSEQGKGTPEDLMFFYKHLSLGGKLLKIEKELLVYCHHPDCESLSVTRSTIWTLRVDALQESVLTKWKQFTIWNAGKQGRRLYRSLTPENQAKVMAFCDVDENKIKQSVYVYEESKAIPKPRVPIIHFTQARPPFILCVKWDLTGGGFEENLASLKLTEGQDYYHFS